MKLSTLIWIPGLFWLFPVYIIENNPISEGFLVIHSVYTAIQIAILIGCIILS